MVCFRVLEDPGFNLCFSGICFLPRVPGQCTSKGVPSLDIPGNDGTGIVKLIDNYNANQFCELLHTVLTVLELKLPCPSISLQTKFVSLF